MEPLDHYFLIYACINNVHVELFVPQRAVIAYPSQYLDAFMQNIDWLAANKRLALAVNSSGCLVDPVAE